MKRPNRFIRLGDAASQGLNVLLLDGDANESVSARCHREGWKTAERRIDRIIFWEREHCRKSHQADIDRAHELSARYPK